MNIENEAAEGKCKRSKFENTELREKTYEKMTK